MPNKKDGIQNLHDVGPRPHDSKGFSHSKTTEEQVKELQRENDLLRSVNESLEKKKAVLKLAKLIDKETLEASRRAEVPSVYGTKYVTANILKGREIEDLRNKRTRFENALNKKLQLLEAKAARATRRVAEAADKEAAAIADAAEAAATVRAVEAAHLEELLVQSLSNQINEEKKSSVLEEAGLHRPFFSLKLPVKSEQVPVGKKPTKEQEGLPFKLGTKLPIEQSGLVEVLPLDGRPRGDIAVGGKRRRSRKRKSNKSKKSKKSKNRKKTKNWKNNKRFKNKSRKR